MNKLITIFLAAFILFSCAEESELPAGLNAGGFKIGDTQKQKEVLSRMSSKKIPYKINERGFVIYKQKDKAAVLGLLRTIEYGEELSNRIRESAVVMNDTHRKLFVSKFEKQGIPYKLESHNGTENITWLQTYGPRVDVIIQEVGFEHHQQATNK